MVQRIIDPPDYTFAEPVSALHFGYLQLLVSNSGNYREDSDLPINERAANNRF